MSALPLGASLMDRRGFVLAVSDGSLARRNLQRSQVVGHPCEALFGELAGLIENHLSPIIEAPVRLGPIELAAPANGVRWVNLLLSPWRSDDGQIGGILHIAENVTDKQASVAELARTETLLDAVVEAIPSMVSVQDYDSGALLRVNRAVESFLALPRDEVLGQVVRMRRIDGSRPDSWDGGAIASRAAYIEEIFDGEGRPRTVEMRRQLIADHEGARHILTVAEDITDRDASQNALRQALRAAEAANAAKSDFLATMSHEIRTPLNGVLGMAQAMANDDLSASQRSRLEVIRQSGETLLEILNDILDLSKIEAGRLELENIVFDLGGAIAAAASGFTPIAEHKGLRLVVDAARAAGACRGDPTRLRQVLANLISNALKFTESGEVRVTAERTRDGVVISVADSGEGIAPEALERLFGKFVQADSSTTRRFGGTGLGLAICRELCELMGGAIVGESALGHGSCFTVTLPLPEADSPAEGAAPATAAVDTGELRILAAEDNAVNQQVLKTIFEQAGVGLTVVGDGLEAVDAYRREDWDIVLMDVQMPILDGPDAARAIRAIEAEEGRRRTPIVALTANAMKHQEEAYLASGMDRLVAKPLKIDELFGVIVELACRAAGAEADAEVSAA